MSVAPLKVLRLKRKRKKQIFCYKITQKKFFISISSCAVSTDKRFFYETFLHTTHIGKKTLDKKKLFFFSLSIFTSSSYFFLVQF